jgi:dihydroflavonol-4-reductase
MQAQQKSILLTGSSGLLGSHILLQLLQEGSTVRCLVRNTKTAEAEIDALAKWYKLELNSFLEQFEFVEGDINQLDTIEDALKGISSVIHAAAMISTSNSDRNSMLKINAEGTANVVNSCLDFGIDKLVYISSVATLGPNPNDLVDEDYFFKQSPETSAYALSKYAAEQEVWRGVEEGLNAIILNPAFIIGPSSKRNGSAAIFHALRAGLPGYIAGSSAYVDVRDVSNAVCLAIKSEIHSKRFIIASENMKTEKFLSSIASALHVKVPSWKVPNYLLPIIVWGSKVQSLFSKNVIPLTWDGIKMARSNNKFDGTRFQKYFPEFNYRSVNESIQDTARYYN